MQLLRTPVRDGSGLTRQPIWSLDEESRGIMCERARNAIDEKRIKPFYQPKIDLASGRIVGFEVLLRWIDENGELRMPVDIEAAFEDPRLAPALGERMQKLALSDMRLWRNLGLDFGRVAINATAAEFRNDDFADCILARLNRAGIAPHCIEVEVTETVFLGRGAENVERALQKLSVAGVTIALDDFGTGYASLSHLKQFPVDSIKIDRSFIQDLADSRRGAAILQAVLQLGKNLGITIIAEGIETEAQAAYLRTNRCDLAQGYLFSPAIPGADIPNFCAQWDPVKLLRRLGAQTRAELWASIGTLLEGHPLMTMTARSSSI